VGSDILEEVFARISKSTIFEDRSKLSPDYVPSRLPFREEQIAKLGSIVAQALKGYKPSNVLLYGLTGTGKTAMCRYVFEELSKYTSTAKPIYVNCWKSPTAHSILCDLVSSLRQFVHRREPGQGAPAQVRGRAQRREAGHSRSG